MCRITGFCGNSNANVTALLQGLLLAEEKNNPHGTGIVIKTTEGNNIIRKKGVRGKTFLLQGHANCLFENKYNYALGHVRFKTAGEQSDRNAHPFGFRVQGKWHYGIHNGIIGNARELAAEFGVKPAAVDSETFWRCVARLQNQGEDIVATIERVTEFISGTGDFAFAYMADREIFFWRNDDRPLCVFDARVYRMGRFIASTSEMFVTAWGWACPDLDIRKVTYFEAKPYKLYRMAVDTHPKHEVEIIKQLKRKPRARISARSTWDRPCDDIDYCEQGSLWEDRRSGIDESYYGVSEFSDKEITDAIFNTQLQLTQVAREDPLHDEWAGFLGALHKEKMRRV